MIGSCESFVAIWMFSQISRSEKGNLCLTDDVVFCDDNVGLTLAQYQECSLIITEDSIGWVWNH